MRTLLRDLRYAIRSVLRAPGFTAVAVLTLAIGMGANTAIFSLIDSMLLRPLPYHDPDRLVRLYESEAAPGSYPFAGPDYMDWKGQNSTFEGMAMYGWFNDMNLSGAGQLDHVLGVPTEANFFSLLGAKPLLGRTWLAGEDQPGRDGEVILSYGLWKSRFIGDAAVIGRNIELNSRKYTVVGVMPATFRFPVQAQLWIPQLMDAKSLGTRGNHWASAIGRLKRGVTIQQARADLSVIAARLERQYPDSNHKVGAKAVALHDDLVGRSRDSLVMMLAAVGLVLLIACANVANLLLSKAVARQKEMAIRCALGAARFRLLRQLLTESLLLALLGGGLGLMLAWGIVAAFPTGRLFNPIRLNETVLAFSAALILFTGVLFGIFPALQTTRPDLNEELKGGAGGANSPGRRRRFTSNALVVAEIALSLLLLISAGLLLKDFAQLRTQEVGVVREGVWTAALQLPQANYKTSDAALRFGDTLIEKTRSIPGVTAAALTTRLPVEGGGNYFVSVRGQDLGSRASQLVEAHAASPDYFRVMGIRLLRGRLLGADDVRRAAELDRRFAELDKAGTQPSAAETNAAVYPCVINERMARFFWPGQNPVGQMFTPGSGNQNGPWLQVMGVVSDVTNQGLTSGTAPEAYAPFTGDASLYLVLRASVAPAALAETVRRTLREIDAGLPLFAVRTMDEVVADQAQGQRFLSGLVGSFAGIALLLAAIGIYGVLSYAVTQRTREIGIRLSLGASNARVTGEVMWQGLRLALIGFGGGIAGALAAGRLLASVLHGVKPDDPVVFVATAGLLSAVALAACYIPARRAAHYDPMLALRYDG